MRLKRPRGASGFAPRVMADTVQLCVVIALTLAVPAALRLLDARYGAKDVPQSYLPALEGPRLRGAFDPYLLNQMRELKPRYVALGDSMGGTRLDTTRFRQLAGAPILDMFQAGSGSVFWYLALKNWVLASGVPPTAVLIFFRDTNLTDIMYRLDEGFRWNIDRVAGEREEEVNAAIARRSGEWRIRMRSGIERAYAADRARLWMVPGFTDRMTRAFEPSRRRRTAFIEQMNERFEFLHIRQMETADIAAVVDLDADFRRDIDGSVLPLMLRDARNAGVTLVFIRVQRRPAGNQPPPLGPGLRQYVADLRAYIEANGGRWRDDTGDPLLTLDMYEDGDHLAQRARYRYTEILFDRIRHLLP